MKSAKEMATEIADLMYQRARLNKKMAEETSTFSSVSHEVLEEGDEVDPTLTLTKNEILDVGERRRLKKGFLEQLKNELELKSIRVKLDKEAESLTCKSMFYKENPNEFKSLRSLRQSIKDDEEFYDS